MGSAIKALAAATGMVVGGYGVYAAVSWYRYGRVDGTGSGGPVSAESDVLLDRFMPAYEIVERHSIRVAAPPAVTLAAACEQDLLHLPVVSTIFRLRELVLGATPDDRARPRGLVASTLSMGWGLLADVPDRELVVGAVTRPWEADVTFRPLPPDGFIAFREPGYVKIVWTLRADADGEGRSVFRTETRAIATDATARARFRRYWAFASPGIALIRRLSLRPLKREAERLARSSGHHVREHA